MRKYINPTIKLSILLLSCILFMNVAKAQYVTIPDTAFVNWLNANGFAGCISNNNLDTTCNTVLSTTTLNCYGVPIRDLTGIQYFKSLFTLDCSNDSLYYIPAFPATLQYINCQINNLDSLPLLPAGLLQLSCDANQLTSLPALPNGMAGLGCGANPITSLPALPDSLQILGCSGDTLTGGLPQLNARLSSLTCDHCSLTSLPALPAQLTTLTCGYNPLLTSLPALPASLTDLDCEWSSITALPALPPHLSVLSCWVNQIAVMPALPASLINLNCAANNLTSIPALPDSLTTLICSANPLTSALPTLPAGLLYLQCEGNQLNILPPLPAGLILLYCNQNNLTSLPALPSTLTSLWCFRNQLTALPVLPPLLSDLDCSTNNLTTIPVLPDSLYQFYCYSNINLTCLPELKKITYLRFDTTAVTCLPNYGIVEYSTPALNSVPLCGIFNPGGCNVYWNISGDVFYDANSNCNFDSTDVGQGYVKIQLNSGGMQQQVFSSEGGGYSFIGAGNTNYTLQPDTTDLPFTVSCPNDGYLTAMLTTSDSLSYGNNFALTCKTEGVDVGVKSVINNYVIPRPAASFTLSAVAGDMSQFYGAHCAAGTGGQVALIYTGQITYHGIAGGALMPATVSGDTIIWNIADFGAVDNYYAFNTLFTIDTNATPGTQVCFTVRATTTANDYNPANNTGYFCFTIVDAIDPNEKEVSPAGNIDTAQWLTYTIRFQNTGSAPAQNIRITDTLDNNLYCPG